jgi:hypothetical protein
VINITKPPEQLPISAGTTITLEGTSGPPTRCVVTMGATTQEHLIGSGPGQLPLTYSQPGGAWGFQLPLPNATGPCVVVVFSQSDKSDGRTYRLNPRPEHPA